MGRAAGSASVDRNGRFALCGSERVGDRVGCVATARGGQSVFGAVEVDRSFGDPDDRCNQVGDRLGTFEADHSLPQQLLPTSINLRIVVVRGKVGHDEPGFVLEREFLNHFLDGNVSAQSVAEKLCDLMSFDARVRHFIANQEQVAAAAAFLEAIDRRLAGHEVHGQFVRLGSLAAAPAFEPQFAEVFVDLNSGFELTDLQRRPIAGGVADAAHEDLRVGQVLLTHQEVHQSAQIALQNARHDAHGTRHVEQHADGATTRDAPRCRGSLGWRRGDSFFRALAASAQADARPDRDTRRRRGRPDGAVSPAADNRRHSSTSYP